MAAAAAYVARVEGFTIVHATLDEPERWQYIFDKLAAAASFTHQNTPMAFFGHTHVPVAFSRDPAVRGGTYTKYSQKSQNQNGKFGTVDDRATVQSPPW
jgi:predicted phosphodiesterase